MAYNSRGLSVAQSGLSGQHYQQWVLDTEDDWGNATTADTILNANYITDAQERGMQVGDPVFVRRWESYTDPYTRGDFETRASAATAGADWCYVNAINSAGAATLLRL